MPDVAAPFRPAQPGASTAERLRAFPLGRWAGSSALEDLIRSVHAVRAEAGRALLAEPPPGLVLVERGLVDVSRPTEDGGSIVLYALTSGEACVLTLSSALCDERCSATATAAVPSELLIVPADVVRYLFDRDAGVRKFVLTAFHERLLGVMGVVRDAFTEPMRARLARLIVARASVGGALQPVEATHKQLAAQLGTAREVVSRLLGELATDGFVELARGRVTVLDSQRLLQSLGRALPHD